jgi:16S rRNA G966 N2-methylase RsmD
MANEVAEMQDFQTRIFNKIREQMGELLTEKELKALLETAMEKAFFQERKVERGYNTVIEPPYFIELIKKEMESQVRLQVSEYMKANKELVIKAIDETIAKGFYDLVRQHQDNMMRGELFNFSEKLKANGIYL